MALQYNRINKGMVMKKIGAILFYAVMLAAVSAAAYDSANGKAGRREFKNTIEANLGDGNTSAKVTLIKKAKRDYANFDIVKDAKLQIESAGKVFRADKLPDML